MTAGRTTGRTRVEFRHGARLTARDLQAATEHERRLHGLHVRGLHDTWGIALGYETALDSTRREVRVGPGLAYDATGDELLLTDAVALPGPVGRATEPVAFDLVLRTAAPLPRSATEARDGVCIGEEGPLAVRIRWVRAGAVALGDRLPLLAPGVRLGTDVPLARFVRAADGTLAGPDLAVSRRVRPLLRPHIASGRVGGQRLRWSSSVGTLEIDTSEAGFNATPLYFVAIAPGSLPLPDNDLLVAPLVSVASAAKDMLTVQVVAAARQGNGAAVAVRETMAAIAKARFEWLGVEPFGGRQPDPAGRWFIRLGGSRLTDLAAWPGLVGLTLAAGGTP